MIVLKRRLAHLLCVAASTVRRREPIRSCFHPPQRTRHSGPCRQRGTALSEVRDPRLAADAGGPRRLAGLPVHAAGSERVISASAQGGPSDAAVSRLLPSLALGLARDELNEVFTGARIDRRHSATDTNVS